MSWRLSAAVLLLLVSGCPLLFSTPGSREFACVSSAECADAYACIDGVCVLGDRVEDVVGDGDGDGGEDEEADGGACIGGACSIDGGAVHGDGGACIGGGCSTDGGAVHGDGGPDAGVVDAGPPAVCGDNDVEGDETCDDGNQLNLDGCSSTCQTEVCPGGDTWFHPAFGQRVELRFDRETFAAPVEGLPVLIRLEAADVDLNALGDPLTLRVVDGDGCDVLPYVLDERSADEVLLWARVPVVESTSLDRIFVYLDATDVPPGERPQTEVFDGDTLGVWHLGGDANDGSGNGRDGTPSGTSATSGLIGQALFFDGDGDSAVSLPAVGGNTGTMSAWIRPAALTGPNGQPLVAVYGANNGDDGFGQHDEIHLQLRDDTPVGDPGAYVQDCGNMSLGAAATVDAWLHITATYTAGGSAQLFLDGEPIDSTLCTGGGYSFNQLYIGRVQENFGDGARRWFHGAIDEVRLSSIPRSALWVKAMHRSGADLLLSAQPVQSAP